MAQHTSARVGNQSDEKVRSLVKAFLKQRKTAATKHEIVTETGLSVYDVEDALEDFIGTFQCVLKADADHNLSYKFDFSDVVGKKDFWKEAQKLGKKLAKWAFMGFITFMLFYNAFVYFPYLVGIGPTLFWVLSVVHLPIWVLLFIYVILDDKTNLLNKGIKFKKSVFRFFMGKRKYVYSIDKWNKNIFQIVFEFVFGEKDSQSEVVLSEEKKVLEYITLNGNRITVSELVMITGWNLHKAEQEITLFMYHYGGNVEVTTEGVLIYNFPDLLPDSSAKPEKVENLYIWNNLLPIKDWNSNYIFVNGLIVIINSFILITSTFLIYSSESGSIPFLPNEVNIHLLPFLFSLSFFAVFIYGKSKHLKRNADKLAQNRFFLYLKQVFANPEKVVFEKQNLLQDSVTTIFNATYENSDDGSIHISFQNIIEELNAIGTLSRIKKTAVLEINREKHKPKETYEKLTKRIFKQTTADKLVYVFRKKVDLYVYTYVIVYSVIAIASLYALASSNVSTGLRTLFLLPTFAYCSYSALKHFSCFTNSTRLELTNKSCTVKSGPIPIGPNSKCYLNQIEGAISKPDIDYLHQLLLNTENEKFYIQLVRKEDSRNLMWEIATEIMEWKEEHLNN
ncbi:hypothetical protein R9C00_21735 [Flammeovirgaceae bacterium SG7u.111]|nr:hypothetical protein [Flammeovirgaceae bacterium SG7u.132]WPO34324.1 hypothetical protein R9C00_21735 [Flammeovirgaceae bacterium SG7u.111]